jgi:hypothetical protein
MEKPEILLSCSYGDIEAAKLAANSLQKEGVLASVTTCAINLQKVIGVVLNGQNRRRCGSSKRTLGSKKNSRVAMKRASGSCLSSSSTPAKGKPSRPFGSNRSAPIYEHLFSDEFKPLAYDLAISPATARRSCSACLQLYYVK